ncbi:MAG: arsenate reductase ArsC [Desulfobulbaceae bacterium]|nr:arsenate reductase ArsC [Desulfobulbaceae bacterium]
MPSPEVQKKILSLCTGNSCRSQMAEGWCRHLKGSTYESHSAGIRSHGLDHLAVEVMAEKGVDISQYRSKTIEELGELNFDLIITLCDHAHETCPFLPGTTIHMGFDDPPKLVKNLGDKENILSHYRRIRDEIKIFISQLPNQY